MNALRKWSNYTYANPTIGDPTLIDTTVEERYLETIPEVDSIKSKRSSVCVPQPEPSFRGAAPSVHRFQHNEPAWSQPSPTIPQDLFGTRREAERESYGEISPISTPRESWSRKSSDDTPVSPIEPIQPIIARAPLSGLHYQSHLPRRVAPEPLRQVQPNIQKEETRWDTYSGEPTQDETGVPSTARPGVVPLEQQYPNLKERTKLILAGIREREQAKKPSWGKQPPPVETHSLDRPLHKEPWKGASGRTALVDPVKNMPSARQSPLYPQRNISRKSVSVYTTVTMPAATEQPTISQPPTQTIRTVASEESIKPIAPLKIRSRDPTPTQITPPESFPNPSPPRVVEPVPLRSPFQSPNPVKSWEEPMLISSMRNDSPQNDANSPTPRTPTPEYYDAQPKYEAVTNNEHEVSRFSWTTYSTSVAESPSSVAHLMRNESPPPPLPMMPIIRKQPISGKFNDNLYMNADAARSQGSIVIRKPVPGRPKAGSVPPPTALSLSKTLPQIPMDLAAGDKISTFEAQLEGLSRRKHNINRIIRDLNADLKKNQINYDMYKRKEIASKVQHHEKELQAITNDEHDIKLVMHRAIKKRDREDCYEQPTGIWVRRVTS